MLKKSWLLSSWLLCVLAWANCIDLNRATEADFRKLMPHIGPRKAQQIIAYRRYYGKFTSLYELEAVPGIGVKYLEKQVVHILSVFCKIQ